MKKIFFHTLARLNKYLLPRYSQRDLNKLSKLDKVIIAYRYFVTKKSLEYKDD